ncbi:hypothetical protein [Desulfobacter sp. UBA2225]|jgi:HTH-type transcriptional regulator/antitoxin HigA|uniref:hypothetical protein n=1 Tax=Desulfobacter sp. UBA2225 TaxID=1961413 RepID=UPI00257E2AC5|nr:hypothetical protein [Desulfobacter sp. UBA2225]
MINDIIRIWPDIKSIFSVAHSKAEYDRQVSFLDSLLDQDEGHPLASLVETVGSLVETYETAHLSEHEGAPADILNCLMQEHGIRQ